MRHTPRPTGSVAGWALELNLPNDQSMTTDTSLTWTAAAEGDCALDWHFDISNYESQIYLPTHIIIYYFNSIKSLENYILFLLSFGRANWPVSEKIIPAIPTLWNRPAIFELEIEKKFVSLAINFYGLLINHVSTSSTRHWRQDQSTTTHSHWARINL